jgi:hypothetical protein
MTPRSIGDTFVVDRSVKRAFAFRGNGYFFSSASAKRVTSRAAASATRADVAVDARTARRRAASSARSVSFSFSSSFSFRVASDSTTSPERRSPSAAAFGSASDLK